MKITNDWMKRRWYDFRNGHSVYLIFAIQSIQFIIISYSLYVADNAALSQVFPSMTHWLVFFVSTYLPAAILIGHVHLKKQIPTEQKQLVDNNPFTFQTAPGKEQLYQLPANLTAYELQLKNMNIQNQMADFVYEVFNRPIDKWSKEEFEKVRHLKEIATRLQKGDSIMDIVREK